MKALIWFGMMLLSLATWAGLIEALHGIYTIVGKLVTR